MRAARRPVHKYCHLELIYHISIMLNTLMLKYCNIGNAIQIYLFMKYTYNVSIYIFLR